MYQAGSPISPSLLEVVRRDAAQIGLEMSEADMLETANLIDELRTGLAELRRNLPHRTPPSSSPISQ